ncbi:hypothetical protein [Kocuria sp.]|uniref:hypothetical protein n=1 Tax=Kocuria sp. TaxID=1871328 RepID=UPI0026DFFA27|nr:hypothetical protein [Kocuria sp.]MDO5617559.1 hypothetical protein [Kocuria sp.]
MKKKTIPAAIALTAALATVSAPAANATFFHPAPTSTSHSTSHDTKSGGTYGTSVKGDVVKDIHGVIWTKVFTWTKLGWTWKWYC